jgi:hypothetical protein
MGTKIEGLSESGITKLLRKAVEPSGQAEWARANGMSQAYVNDVCNFKVKPGPKIARALGYRKKAVFVPLQPPAK